MCVGVLVLRYTRPEAKRPFRTPFGPAVAVAGLVLCLAMPFEGLQAATWLRFLVWFLLGTAIYAAYGYRHSRLRALASVGNLPQYATLGSPEDV